MKNKDPAILFYTSDFLTGVTLMNYEQRGKYITLLCLQHQNGHLTEEDMLTVCGKRDKKVFEKFKKDDNGLYFNERIDEEKEKRKAYTKSRTQNGQKGGRPKNHMETICKPYANHMESICKPYENHTENENELDSEIILSSEDNKDNNILLINNIKAFSFSTNNDSAGACEDISPLKNQIVTGSENGACLFITDAQITDLKNRLTEEELNFYLSKMNQMLMKGYSFGCAHYDFILKMAEEDRRLK